MSTFIHTTLLLKDRLFDRLKEARQRLGLKQVDLAAIGNVSRATQVSYETDVTTPNTNYLRLVQGAGLDIPFVLFGINDDTLAKSASAMAVNWKLLQSAYDEVEFFCIKAAPNCPSSYRWQLIQRVYTELNAMQDQNEEAQNRSPQEIVRTVWDKV